MSDPLKDMENETLYKQPEMANMDLITNGLYLGK